MTPDRLRLSLRVEEDWIALGDDDRREAREALRSIDEDPLSGTPLFDPLRGLWSLLRGPLRVLYRVGPEGRVVIVVKIGRVGEQR